MAPNQESQFRAAFRKAVENLPNKDAPLVSGGLSPAQYADALESPDAPTGRLLVKMADALSQSAEARAHGHHHIVQLFSWMAKVPEQAYAQEERFSKAFRKTMDRLPNKDTPLVQGGLSPAQYADALENPKNPEGRVLVKMAQALDQNPKAMNHGYHQAVQLFDWMAKLG